MQHSALLAPEALQPRVRAVDQTPGVQQPVPARAVQRRVPAGER
ncbi:MAG: hypothetical protein WA768_20310 [Mycobacterium sp.]